MLGCTRTFSQNSQQELVMATYRTHGIAFVAVCAVVVLFSSATGARAQAKPPSEAEALSLAVKASPELVNGLAKQLGTTPEQAAGAAGVLFTLAKSLVKPEDFAAMSKDVPGMDALLAATPASVAGTFAGSASSSPSFLTPGIASSTLTTKAAQDGTASATAGISNLGINPEMIAKALPFLSGFLKKYGGGMLGSLLESLFKGSAKPAK
jgi:hypothetical protein